ncbi:MAG: aspartate kinase, partial [Bacteroidota bacterium]
QVREEAITDVFVLFSQLKTLCEGVRLLEESTPRTVDSALAFGEKLSTVIFFYACKEASLDTVLTDAEKLMETNSNFNSAQVDLVKTKQNVLEFLNTNNNSKRIIITQGFIGSDENGITTTLGRGGSDYSAAVFGAVLIADEIQIWTDVSGVLSADPRLVKNTITIPQMSYSEIRELSFFGAKVLHPDTIMPAIENRIPVRIMNTFEPDNPGTLFLDKIESEKTEFHSVLLKNKCKSIQIKVPVFTNPVSFFSNILAEIAPFKDCIFFSAIVDNHIKILLNVEKTGIEEIFGDMLHNYEIEIKDVAFICICGTNFLSGNAETNAKIIEIQNILYELKAPFIFLGSTQFSLLFTVAQDHAQKVLKVLHEKLIHITSLSV